MQHLFKRLDYMRVFPLSMGGWHKSLKSISLNEAPWWEQNKYMSDSGFGLSTNNCHRTKSNQLDTEENLSVHQTMMKQGLLGSPAVQQAHSVFSVFHTWFLFQLWCQTQHHTSWHKERISLASWVKHQTAASRDRSWLGRGTAHSVRCVFLRKNVNKNHGQMMYWRESPAIL